MTQILDVQKAAGPSEVVSLQNLTKTILDHALAHAKDKIPVAQRQASLDELFSLPAFFSSFKYGMAQGVAAVLSENDRLVRTVYVYEPSMNADLESGEDLPESPIVHLLILGKSSAALVRLVDSLDRSLAAALQQLAPRQYRVSTSVLDANFLTEQDMQQGTGYAALLSSSFAPAIRLWPQES